jgi:hypothetical protein
MIVALAGRRIDAADADPAHFPLDRVEPVRARLRTALREVGARVLVSAAACGADLAALETAATIGIRRHIVLPAPAGEFREHSVADRPGNWGPVFDQIVADVAAAGNLDVVRVQATDSALYLAVNAIIIERAVAIAAQYAQPLMVFAIWDGPLSGRTDYTQDFVATAIRRDIAVRSIPIMATG